MLGHSDIFQHLRGKTATDWLSLVPQEMANQSHVGAPYLDDVQVKRK